ncbi:hypothetical protein BB561_000238 [Smittium simulii]|uniref:Reverse transcriptase domain-containing protein n=1 Tax=Smittium simulii TaxID=133385 RepID=A0A2T9YZV7_9FUNG|nr:hypothetical protein BB561_000238 [Smittium simulii]
MTLDFESSSPSSTLGRSLFSILFDIYINDIFNNVTGVSVPGITTKIPGLLFADYALVAETSDELKSALNTITKCTDVHEMQINNRKRGIIFINPSTTDNFKIQNKIVSIVEKYTYLGIIFNNLWECN